MTHSGWNNMIWALSVLLECALLTAVFWRGLARRVMTFTVLLAFYPLRAVVLFALFHHISAEVYTGIYTVLSIVDLLLQFAVETEIVVLLLRGWRKVPGMSGAIFVLPVVPLVSVFGTFAMLRMLPLHAPVRPDRMQMLLWMAMVFVALCAFSAPASALLRRVSGGFAVYGVAGLIATAGRTLAAAHRDAAAFNHWSYVTPIAYVVVVMAWILLLKDDAAAER